MKNMPCIYKIVNPKGFIYVGQTVNLHLRKISYKKGHAKKQKKVFASLAKYGYKNHIFSILETCPRDKLNEREQHWIAKLDSFNNGLNLTSGGDARYILSKEARKRISESKKGKNNPMYGKIGWSRGIKFSKEYREKLSKSHLGKMKGRENPFYKGDIEAYKNGVLVGVFEGEREASKELGVCRRNINSVVNGKRKTAGGFVFIRLNN